MDQEEVARVFRKYDAAVIPVVDKSNHLVGIITVDDIVDVVIEEATEDIYKLSGTSDIEQEKLLSGKIFLAVKSRIPWLLLTIIGGFIASTIINIYSDLFKAHFFSLALSLSFVPLLMGLGGNVANQSATIIVRGLSTGHVDPKDALKHIGREILVGLTIGLFISTLVFIFNIALQHPPTFSYIVFLAIVADIFTAALIGSSLPIIFHKIKIDPAVASAPFISTTLDIIGQLIYFALIIFSIVLI